MLGYWELFATLFVAGFAVWLGLYLIAREPTRPLLWSAGAGLLAYGVAIGFGLLVSFDPFWARVSRPLLLLPMLFWLGTLFFFLPETHPLRQVYNRPVPPLLLATALLITLTGLLTPWVYDPVADQWQALGYGFILLFLLAVTALGIALFNTRDAQTVSQRRLALVATLFFALGMGGTALPLLPIPTTWLVIALGLDLVLLGVAVASFDAFQAAETVRLDILRSFGTHFLLNLIVAGQIVLVMVVSGGPTLPLVALLLGVMLTLLTVVELSDYLSALVDRLLLARQPRIREERAALRATVTQLARQKPDSPLAQLSQDEFNKLTRRALSQMGNLPRLAASPLTQLPQVESRLQANGSAEQAGMAMARAAELKALLTERIEQLQPRDKGAFGTTDEWRHYNALYFPYVMGLRPYSRRALVDVAALPPAGRDALAWFQREVPERTLYNWQNAAAKLIAADLFAEIG